MKAMCLLIAGGTLTLVTFALGFVGGAAVMVATKECSYEKHEVPENKEEEIEGDQE